MKRSYVIRGLDCIEEVRILKAALAPLLDPEEDLHFDPLAGRMSVDGDVDDAAIRAAVAASGMKATPADEFCGDGSCVPEESFWQRRGRALLCALSGLLLVGGFVAHGLAHGFADALGADNGAEHRFPAHVLLLYAGAILTGYRFVLPRAWSSLRRLRPDMHLLMSVAVLGAIVLGEYFEAASVSFLFALSLLLESWSVARARRSIESLLDLSPNLATIKDLCCGTLRQVPIEEVAVGKIIQVLPGEKIPLDGRVILGESAVSEAAITGEPLPRDKAAGDEVFAGTLNGDATLEIEVTRAAADTTLAHIIHLVEEAKSRRAPSERWVERFALYYTPAMMGLALAVALLPPLLGVGGWLHWFYTSLVVLVIACPCALVISTPVSVVAGLASAARAGVLVKGGIFLEIPARLKAMAFDKTGTLTLGQPELTAVIPLRDFDEDGALRIAAALEEQSTHPLARAILDAATRRGISPALATEFELLPGRGATAIVEGRRYWLGSPRFLEEQSLPANGYDEAARDLLAQGQSLILLLDEGGVCALLGVADTPRKSAAPVMSALRRLGIENLVMLTGDHAAGAKSVAELVGVDEVRSRLLPAEKVTAVEELVARHGSVAMVGDGINDAPALAAADLGIAMGAMGSDAAIETADIALMSDDLTRLPWLLRHSRRVLAVIRQNIIFALGIKLLFLGLAAGGLATLWMAIAADMGASLLVIGNGLRLLNGKSGKRAS